MVEAKTAIRGIRIVDFGWFVAGPLATKVLADHGAEVIRIESTTRPCSLRLLSAPVPAGKSGLNVSGAFNEINGSKLSLTLNLNHPTGIEMAERLIAVSDVVVDNFTPDVMKGWGLDHEKLVKIKPDIITISMPAQGSTGPHRGYRSLGGHLQAGAGLDSITGMPQHPPVGVELPYPDYSCNPYHAAVAILAALRYKNRTGKGQHIELRQHESTVSFLGPALLDYAANGLVQGRVGNRSQHAAPHNAYRCKGEDRWCTIAVFTDKQWQSFCEVLGNPDWTKTGKFATLQGRKANEEELDRLVGSWTAEHPAEEVMALMQAAAVDAGVVQDPRDLLERDPHLKERGVFQMLEHPEAGMTVHLGVPFKLSVTPGKVRRHAPLLGEHNDYVCQDLLGMPQDEINERLLEGAIGAL